MNGFQHGRRLHEATLNTDARMADSLLQDTHRLRYFLNLRFPILCFRLSRSTLVDVASYQ